MKTYLIATLLTLLTLISPTQAMMLETSIIQGKIKSFDSKNVVLIDGQGQVHKVNRSDISESTRLKQGMEISIHKKVDAQMFKFAHLPFKLENVQKMPLESVRQLYKAYSVFLIQNDRRLKADGTMDKNQRDKTNQFTQIFQCLIDTANADEEVAAPTNFNCFYAGWPTPRTSANQCRPPWNQAVIDAQTGENASFQYTRCGPDNTFRCNPVLFGPGTQHTATTGTGPLTRPYPGASVRVIATTNPEKGVCVTATQSTVVQNCLAATSRDLGRNIQRIKDNPADFNRFAASVESFCRERPHRNNPACLHLGERLADIQFGLRAKATGRTAESGSACTATDQGNFNQGMGAASDATCPGQTCFVRASCPTTGGGPLEITSVCRCSTLMGSASSLPAVLEPAQIVACVNDESISVINPAPVSPENNPANATIPR